MTNRKALIVGGIGGLLPVVMVLAQQDASTMYQTFDWARFAGHCTKAILLSLLGALLVWINSIDDLKQALQIGIMAPAVVVGFMAGSQLEDTQNQLSLLQKTLRIDQAGETETNGPSVYTPAWENQENRFSFITPAFAQAAGRLPKGYHQKPPSSLSRFWYGLSGSLQNAWFVVTGSHKTRAAADAQIRQLKAKGYTARVLPPKGANKYYSVVIGSWLTAQQAKRLTQQAVKDGLPRNTFAMKYKP
jgi:hypothetical protein